MKKYAPCFIGLLLLCCWQCSDFIDVHPENSTTYTNYFKSEKDAEALLTELQVKTTSIFSQQWNSNIADQVHKYFEGWGVPNMLGDWSCTYSWQEFASLVYQANLLIDNAHRFDLSEEILEPYLLQAYFTKGVAYFYMAMIWGEAPIFPNTTTFEKVPKSSIDQLLDEAEANAIKAMALPSYEEVVAGTTYKRMKQYGSKGAATALLAHIHAWKAGVLGIKESWEKAEEYCTMIIEGKTGTYSLAKDPEEVCVNVMKGDSPEAIWEIYGNAAEEASYAKNIGYVGFPIISTGNYFPGSYSTACLSREEVRKIYPEGDLRRNSYYWATDADFIYLNQVDGKVQPDLQPMGEVLVIYDLDAIVEENSSWLGEYPFSESYLTKFRYPYYEFDDWSQQPEYKGLQQNKVIWRLAEIYLLRAECRARQDKANAVEDLNLVRARAYGNLENGTIIDPSKEQQYVFPSANDIKQSWNNNILLAIFKEREKELLYEGHRYYDIVRNGMCFIRGEESYDYIREEISPAYKQLTNQDIRDGALYSRIDENCFKNNDLIRQNRYWNRKIQ